MVSFVYTAKNAQGQLISGVLEAPDANAVAKALVEKQLYPVKIEQKKSGSSQKVTASFFDRISTKQKAQTIRQFATLITAGLPVAKALSVLVKQLDKPYIKKIFANILKDIENGESLSKAFSRFPSVFSVTEISLLQAGEASGTLDGVLTRMARQLEKDYSLKSKIRSAMIYPSFVLVAVLGVIGVMFVYVIPKMQTLYDSFKGKLPAVTLLLMNISKFMVQYWWMILVGIIGTIVAIKAFISTPGGRILWDKLKINIPGIGVLVKMVILARFTRTLGTLMGSGVPVLDSLTISSNACGNVIYKERVLKVAEAVKGGKSLSEPLENDKYFPPVVCQMIGVGEQTGEMDKMLEGLANYYEEEVDTLIKGLSAIIEPVIIVVLGLVVGGIMVAIMLPIYRLSDIMYKK
ncbi:hypothetical protein AUK11_00885 [bacterium CG2_30_37_16]|nr:MAG: hypothetical protein AUK11_00885 [bacterium CG2_30_37_16]PIP31194.1 MAG: pilus assembly protein PilC [bacterium (Candidatus Howlettbacteria) CG23_combo_of_CG06-09_8_20_14_all_37_9]PIX99113.1 MAG: pilus assembly protein PilC [bacterium (Candidatus Howlettbacteria) CG_4_10_14_3_um_filter_37_10]PJB06449.1 MAG: pilus assembly protein PilC [bacterium (Candidatus Howlettbacteria) CG_4_9_14_3_um_filter_37_10]